MVRFQSGHCWYGVACLLLALVAVGAGCDTQGEQDAFAERASRAPSGFTETDANGRVLSEDTDDWNTSPVYLGVIRVSPAFPNPTAGDFVTIPVTITQFNAVRGRLILRGFNSSDALVGLDDIPGDIGGASFTFAPGLLGRRGLQRVFIFDSGGEIVSYGDVMIE